MKFDISNKYLILPGITLQTVQHLAEYEKQYRFNLNRIILSDYNFYPKNIYEQDISRQKIYKDALDSICYAICRGLFGYPCVAEKNRISAELANKLMQKTYLAKPMFRGTEQFQSLFYQGAHRMKPVEINNQMPIEPDHNPILEQLNKIRECNACSDQPSCLEHKYVLEATQIVIREYKLENSFVGKLLARSLSWMSAEEARLMRLVEKEGMLVEPASLYPPNDEAIQEEFFNSLESKGYYSDESEPAELPAEPHPLLQVIHDLRESIRDTIRLLNDLKNNQKK